MTDTPTIRTHTTTVGGDDFDQFIPVPYGWEPGLPVLVVAGLPEGATIRRRCDLDETWEFQAYGGWLNAGNQTTSNHLVVCRPVPVPVPAPPAAPTGDDDPAVCGHRSDRLPSLVCVRKAGHDGSHTWDQASADAWDDEPTVPTRVRCGACGHWQSDHRDGHGACVEDDEAAMGGCGCETFTTDVPQADTPTPEHTPRALDPHVTDPNLDPRCVLDAQHGGPCQPENDDDAPADTPTPEGRWVTVYVGDKERRPTPHWETEDDLLDPATDKLPPEAWDALVELVRRDGTAPTPEKVVAWARPRDLFPRWVTATASESHRTITVRVDRADYYHTVPLAAVRALRDGAAR